MVATGGELLRDPGEGGTSFGRDAAICRIPTISIHTLERRFGTDQDCFGGGSADLATAYSWLTCQKRATMIQGH